MKKDGYYWALINVKMPDGRSARGWAMTRVAKGIGYIEAADEGVLVGVPCEDLAIEWSGPIDPPGCTTEDLRTQLYQN